VVKRRVTRAKRCDEAGPANPDEGLICGNAGICKDLGALPRSAGLPQRPASSRFSSRMFPGESNKTSTGVFGHLRSDSGNA
jgi:hypothetical protein